MEPTSPLTLEALQIFGEMLRARRQQSEWSCHRISAKINMTPATVSAVENGETWPLAAEREALGNFLGYDVDTFDKIVRRLRREQAPNVINLADRRK